MAGNLAGFEEASRALFADDRRRFVGLVAGWPDDIRDHVVKLAFSDHAEPPSTQRSDSIMSIIILWTRCRPCARMR